MRKIFMLFLISMTAFAKPLSSKYDEMVKKERQSILKSVDEIKNKKGQGIFVLTGLSNDFFLEEFSKIDKNEKIAELRLVFPDIRYVDKHIDKIAKLIPDVIIYLLDKKSDEEGLEFRDLQALYELKLDKKLEKLGNITVIAILVSEEDKKKIIPNSFSKNPLDDEIVKKYIFGR